MRDLLARRLGVEVDEHVVDLAAESCSAASTSGNAARPAFRKTLPERFTTPRRTPSRSTTQLPWPGWLRR